LTIFFSIGLLLLTIIQHSGNPEQAGLDHFIFGKAASLVFEDVIVFGTLAIFCCLVVIALFKELRLLSFDNAFAQALGLPIRRLEIVLTTLTVLAVITGIQAVGVVLMGALLITPASSARYWTERVEIMLILSAIFGAFSGVAGAFISYIAPSMPTGPWIVVVLTTIFLVSVLFAPRRGIAGKKFRQIQAQRRTLHENILKALFHLGELRNDFTLYVSLEEIQQKRSMNTSHLRRGLRKLQREGYIDKNSASSGFRLTTEGLRRGKRIARLHRLWEVYLVEIVHLQQDHVHDDAESIEHILTPEIEAELETLLKNPTYDPHQRTIPRR
jgi:manganese/zinc/iron transport system permease protein